MARTDRNASYFISRGAAFIIERNEECLVAELS
jgi:hypothetical protein